MRIEVYSVGIYRVVKISEPLSVISHLEELRSLIQGYLSQGQIFLAVGFTESSYLYSGAISVLISCYKMVQEKGGDLCIIEPKPELSDLMRQMGIDTLLNVYLSQSDLPSDPRQIEEVRRGFRG